MSSLRVIHAVRAVSRLSRTVSTSTRAMRVVVPAALPRMSPSLLSRTFSLSARAFAAPAEESANKTLLKQLEEELTHEQEIMTGEGGALPQPDFIKDFLKDGVWMIEDKPGQDEVVISRKYNNETIRLMFTISDVENAEPSYDEESDSADEEDAGSLFPIRCSISVSKPSGGALSIEAMVQDGMFSIESVSYYKDAQLANDLTAESDYKRRGTYLGPQFEHLDVHLQEAFEAFLHERGIDESLALVVPEYAEWKEQKEYVDWIKGVKDFVAA